MIKKSTFTKVTILLSIVFTILTSPAFALEDAKKTSKTKARVRHSKIFIKKGFLVSRKKDTLKECPYYDSECSSEIDTDNYQTELTPRKKPRKRKPLSTEDQNNQANFYDEGENENNSTENTENNNNE